MTDLSKIRGGSDASFFKGRYYKEKIIGNRRVFQCSLPICGKICRFKSEINRHIAAHSSIRPFPCPHPKCGKSFKRPDALNNHLRIHNELTPYMCTEEKCGYQFSSKSALNYHLLTHNGERIYQCDQPGCDRAFTTYGQLKQHMKAVNYHNKLKVLSLANENSLTSHNTPETPSTPESGNIVVLPVIRYDSLEDLGTAKKKFKVNCNDFIMKSTRLDNNGFNSVDLSNDIYAKVDQESPREDISEVLTSETLEPDRKKSEDNNGVERKFYNELKSLLEENDSDINYKCLAKDGELIKLLQNGTNRANINKLDNNMAGKESIELWKVKEEDFPDFESWLQAEGRDNLFN